MNYKEKKIISVFADSNLDMDPKFRTNLRSQLSKRSATVGQAPRGYKFKTKFQWPRLVTLSLACTVVLVIVGLIGTSRPQNSKYPFALQQVSAAEVIQRAKQFKTSFNPADYTFFESISTQEAGPWWKQCGVGSSVDPANTMSTYYVYRAKDNGIEASYTHEVGDGKTIQNESVYDQTSKRILPSYAIPSPASPNDLFNVGQIQSKSEYLFVDEKGNPASGASLRLTQENGRGVYVVYTKINPAVLSPYTCRAPDSTWTDKTDPKYGETVTKPAINREVFDANTFQSLEYDVYVNGIADDNLVVKTTFQLTYNNDTAKQALQIMTAAGFDRSSAVAEFPAGHD